MATNKKKQENDISVEDYLAALKEGNSDLNRQQEQVVTPPMAQVLPTVQATIPDPLTPTPLMTEEEKARARDALVRQLRPVADAIGVPLDNLLYGYMSRAEGIGDALANITGIFGNDDYKRKLQDFVAVDSTKDMFGGVPEAPFKSQFLQGVIQSIGGMGLDAVANLAAPGAGLASLGVGAAGKATEEAYNDGASYGRGTLYGIAQGATEVATEKLTGGMLDAVYGRGLLDGVTKSIARNTVGRAAKNMIEEGAEEVLSELASPLEKAIYKGRDALSEYGTADYWKGVALAGAAGAVTSGIVGGATGQISNSRTAAELTNDAVTNIQKRATKDANGKLTAKGEAGLTAEIKADLEAAQKYLSKMSDSKRADFFAKNAGASAIFTEDGKIRPEFARKTWGGQSATKTANGAQAQNAGLSEGQKRYVSVNARYDGERATNAVKALQDALDKQGKGETAEIYSGELSSEQEETYAVAKRIVNNLNQTTGDDMALIVVGGENDFNALNEKNGNAILISEKTLSKTHGAVDALAKILFEEATHSTQSRNAVGQYTSAWYAALVHELATGNSATMEAITARLLADGNGYGFTQEMLEGLESKLDSKESLTAKEQELLDEIGAQTVGEILGGNKEIVEKYASNKNAAEKILGVFGKIKKALSRATNKTARAERARVERVEGMLLNALAEKGLTYRDGKVISARQPEEKENTAEAEENDEAVRFSFKNSKNGMANDKLLAYSEEMRGLIEQNGNIIIDSPAKLQEVIDMAFDNPTKKATAYFGILTADVLQKIENNIPNIPRDVRLFQEGREYSVATTLDNIRHLVDEKKLSRGEVLDYLDRLADTIADFDSVSYSVYEQDGSRGVLCKKRFADGTLISYSLVSNKRKSLNMQTVYLDSKDYQNKKRSLPNPAVANATAYTSKTRAGQTSDNSISQSSENVNPKSEKSSEENSGIRFSLPASEITEENLSKKETEYQTVLSELNAAKNALKSFTEFDEQSNAVSEALKTKDKGKISDAIDAFSKWSEQSGYGKASEQEKSLDDQARQLRSEVQQIKSELSKQLRNRTYTDEEIRNAVSKAVRKFHTTTSIDLAGYLTTTGSMLDFSEGQGYRIQDHREIADVLDLPDYAEHSDGMIAFMNMGNIRLQTYGIDIAAMPNAKQISALRSIIRNVMQNEGEFTVDFSLKNGHTDGSVTYPEGTSPERIIADIRNYFESGQLPDDPSEVAQFHNLRFSRTATPTEEDNRYLSAVQNGDTASAQKMVDEAAKRAGYTEKLYHGTKAFGFTVFDPKMSDDKLSLFATRNEEIARSYSGKDEVRRIASRIDLSDVDKYSEKEMIAKLNDFAEYYDDEKTIYSLFDQERYDYLRRTVKKEIVKLEDQVSEIVERYNDEKTKSRLERLLKALENKDYPDISTQLYLMLNNTDVFSEQNDELSELEKNIRIVNEMNGITESNDHRIEKPSVLQEALGGYSIEFMSVDEARDHLKELIGRGNYALYGNPGRQLDIDAKGQLWRDIKGWTKSIEPTLENSFVYKDGNEYILFDKETENTITNGRLEITDSNREWVSNASEKQIHIFLISKVANTLRIQTQNHSTTRDIARWAKNLGYDSVLIKNLNDFGGHGEVTGIGDIEIYFDPNRLKSADPVTYDEDGNVIPLSERFNEQNEDIRFSRGLNARVAANNTGERMFSKKVAKAAIETIMESNLVFGDEYSTLRGTIRGKGRIIDELFYKLNRTQNRDYQRAVANSIADQIIDSTVLTETYSAFAEQDAANIEQAKRIAEMMSGYRHGIKFKNIEGDVKYAKDDRWEAYKLQWAAKEGDPLAISADQLVDAFDEIGVKIDAVNDAEIFLEAMRLYENARETINNAVYKVKLSEYGSQEELARLKKTISDEIMQVFENGGERSKFSKMVSRYTDQIKFMREMWKVSKKVGEIKMEGKRFASDTRSPQLNAATSLLKGMTRGSNLIPGRAREVCRNLAAWYSPENNLFKAAEGQTDEKGAEIKTNRFFNPQIHEMMETIGNGEGGLTAAEITDLSHIMDFMANFAKTYKRVFQNGRYVDADTIAEADISLARKAKHGYARNAVVRFVQKTAEDYGMFVFDPATVARMADGYRNGFFTHLHEEMREAALQMAAVRYELQTAQSEFYKEHKGYAPEKRIVTVRGVEMPADYAISLYMTAKRKQSWLGLVQSGYRLFLEDGEVSAKALGAKDEVYTDEQLADIVKGFRSEIDRVLTDTDRAYIATVEGVLKRAGELKMERDIQRMGFTNATEDYYYPILRAHMAKEFDADLASGKAGYFDTVTNLSMNKDTVKNNAELGIQSVNQVISRHIDQTAMYYGLSNMVDNFNMLSNLNLSDNPGKPETMLRTANESIFGKKAMQYFQKMLKDLEGVYYADPSEKSWNRRIDKLRSNAAVAAIAANPKVIATQFSSLFAGTAILSPRDLAKGITLTKVGKYSDVDKYSEVARLRNANLEAARAETITDKVGKLGEFGMRPVAATDRLVVQIEFGACQAYVERTQGLAIGTEENLVAAGKLLNRVINETQQGANLTERSAMARSSNPIYKGLAMFRNDAVKQIGRVIDGFGELGAIKDDLRTETDAAKIEELKGRQRTVRRKTAKAVGALVGASMYQALIGLLFAAFLNRLKDKEKDEITRDVVVDSVAGLFTGLPIISQSIEFFTDGYGVEDFTISSFNDLLQSTQDMVKVVGGKATEGEVKSAIRGAIYSGGKLLGIPTRNAYNYFYGTVNTINEYAGYQVHGLLYSDNYKSELYKALNDGNTDRAQMLGSLLVDSSFGGYSKATNDAIKPLVAAGYTVLPRTVGDSVTYDGQEYKLTSRQKTRFQKVYGQASAAVQKVVALQSYRKLSDEVKAKTIKRIYDMYYNLAIDDLLGTDTEDKTVLFSYAIDPDKLALIVAQAQSLQADTDKNGNAIAGSKKQKVVAYISGLKLTPAQKYMIMGYLGYRNAKGEEQVKAYINRIGALSKAEKKSLFEYSGYAA